MDQSRKKGFGSATTKLIGNGGLTHSVVDPPDFIESVEFLLGSHTNITDTTVLFTDLGDLLVTFKLRDQEITLTFTAVELQVC